MTHLLVIGERGWKSRDVIDLLERGIPQDHVTECGRLSDAAVAGLLKGARALPLSSFAEGYGLPLAEAMTQGAPVLCRDIPVFREVGGDIPGYVRLAAWPGMPPCSTMHRPTPRSAKPSFEHSLLGLGPHGRSISPWSKTSCARFEQRKRRPVRAASSLSRVVQLTG